jgi:biopolymer transport protein ExbD
MRLKLQRSRFKVLGLRPDFDVGRWSSNVGRALRHVRRSFSEGGSHGKGWGEGGMFEAFHAFPSQAEMIACSHPIMKKRLPFLATVAFVLFFSGCNTGPIFPGWASGPSYNSVKDTFPSIAANAGRVFIYRDAIYSPGKTPAVLLNGGPAGLSKAQGFFYVDRPAGEYKVEIAGEKSSPASFTLSPGQTVFVRINVHTNLSWVLLYPEVVDASIAQRELIRCKYTSGSATSETLPEPGTANQDQPPAKAEPISATNDESPTKIEISIDQGGQISINGDPIPDNQLLPLLKEDHDNNPNIAVLIKADKSTPVQKIDNVLHACTAAGVNQLSLQTQ